MKVYPLEFYILWEDFEPWEPLHSIAIQGLLQYFITFDWFMELVRSRLTEVYDKDFVDRLIPFREDLLYWNNTECMFYKGKILYSNLRQRFKENGTL